MKLKFVFGWKYGVEAQDEIYYWKAQKAWGRCMDYSCFMLLPTII